MPNFCCPLLNKSVIAPYNVDSSTAGQLGPFAQTFNPSKWESDIWGWLEVRRSAVNQHPHLACRKCGHSGGTWGWLGVERCQLCLQDTSRSAKWHRQAAVGHWVSLCVWSVVGWLIVYQDGDYLYPGQHSQTICRLQIGWYRLQGGNILMARPSTLEVWKFRHETIF